MDGIGITVIVYKEKYTILIYNSIIEYSTFIL